MLDELPAAYRSVITLVDSNEMDYAEAAESLRVPIGTLKSRLARARMQMQEKLHNAQRPRCGLFFFSESAVASSNRS